MNGRNGFLGIVMLDTRFPRPAGDIGHADTFPMPVRREVVRGVWPQHVVRSAQALHRAGLAPLFQAAVRQLAQDGARAVATSCGFLVLLQGELQAATSVPVVSSGLLLLPRLLRSERQVGVLTISAASLGAAHLLAAGVPADRLPDVLVQGVAPDGEFAFRILNNHAQMDLALARDDVVAAACALQARAPALKSLVLECTNMPPYRAAVEQATGLNTVWLADCSELRAPFAAPAR